ncbi:MAG: type II secretion system F family protein [Planctomycetota bacterium]|nr:type II secretion system F family protein [Planctomycetota bacterium]
MLDYFQETPAMASRRIFGVAVSGVLRVIIEIIIWSVVGFLALVAVSGCLAMGFGPIFGWLSPLVVVFLFYLGLQITQTVRRRRGLMALSYVEQAVRLNLPLPRMLEAAERSESPRLRRRLERVRYLLGQGFPVAQALSDGVPEIPTRTAAAVHAAEVLGRLREGLRRALDDERAAAARTIGRVDIYRTYPMLMILAIASMISLISIFVMPKYEQIFNDFGLRLPPITVNTIRTAGQLAPVALIVSGVVVLAWVGGLIWEAAHPRSLRDALSIGLLDRVRWYAPFWHGMQRDEGLAEVCALMADALSAGMPAGRTLVAASRLRINAVLRGRAHDWAAHVDAGETLAAGAASAGLPKLVSSMLSTARGAAGAQGVFQFLARYYRSRFSRAALLVEAAVVPVTVLFFAAIVACVALSLFLPMVSLIENLVTPWGVM